jgi:aryl-alcohol dehydrogenase-like predicted oxidoreductase
MRSDSVRDREGPCRALTRREALWFIGAAAALPGATLAGEHGPQAREIPGSGESLPAVGLGTWQAFDVPPDGSEYDSAAATLSRFLSAGGRLIDTSPMYGRAEERIGDILAATDPGGGAFLATKVWTRGREAGRRQLEASLRYLRRNTLDLVQVHNLVDFDTHWATLQAARDAGEVRYLGITHWQASAHEDLERTLRSARPDFLQVNYSLAEPEAGERLLPLARDRGAAVLVNRPFTKGAMIDRARGHGLPPEAAALGCRSAAQLFLKWVLGDPAVTVALAGTRNPDHAKDNLDAASPPFPDARQRLAIERWFASL